VQFSCNLLIYIKNRRTTVNRQFGGAMKAAAVTEKPD